MQYLVVGQTWIMVMPKDMYKPVLCIGWYSAWHRSTKIPTQIYDSGSGAAPKQIALSDFSNLR